jgi:hypothetical protein
LKKSNRFRQVSREEHNNEDPLEALA